MSSVTLLERFPQLAELPSEQRQRLESGLRRMAVPAGTRLFQPGARCDNYLMLLEGQVRVQMDAESGREIVLYRVTGGQTCVLTTACLLGGQPYGASAFAETELDALMLPAAGFDALLGESALFRRFVFASYALRLESLLMVISEIAGRRIDRRLARLLVERAAAGPLTATHYELAVELGSAREVISRQLKDFEQRGWLRLGRGRLEVLDAAALSALAAAES